MTTQDTLQYAILHFGTAVDAVEVSAWLIGQGYWFEYQHSSRAGHQIKVVSGVVPKLSRTLHAKITKQETTS